MPFEKTKSKQRHKHVEDKVGRDGHGERESATSIDQRAIRERTSGSGVAQKDRIAE